MSDAKLVFNSPEEAQKSLERQGISVKSVATTTYTIDDKQVTCYLVGSTTGARYVARSDTGEVLASLIFSKKYGHRPTLP